MWGPWASLGGYGQGAGMSNQMMNYVAPGMAGGAGGGMPTFGGVAGGGMGGWPQSQAMGASNWWSGIQPEQAGMRTGAPPQMALPPGALAHSGGGPMTAMGGGMGNQMGAAPPWMAGAYGARTAGLSSYTAPPMPASPGAFTQYRPPIQAQPMPARPAPMNPVRPAPMPQPAPAAPAPYAPLPGAGLGRRLLNRGYMGG